LAPDTYRICDDATVDDIIKLLLDTFNDRIYSKYSSLGEDKFYKDLIMASIVEKEERNTTNKPIVA
jgi:cell division protein YceG involved in septum cleavage